MTQRSAVGIGLVRWSKDARPDCDIPFILAEAFQLGIRTRIHHGFDGHAKLLSNEARDWLSYAAKHSDGNHANAQVSAWRDLGRGRFLPKGHARQARYP